MLRQRRRVLPQGRAPPRWSPLPNRRWSPKPVPGPPRPVVVLPGACGRRAHAWGSPGVWMMLVGSALTVAEVHTDGAGTSAGAPSGVRGGVDGKGLGHLDLPGRWTRNEPTLRTCGDNKVSVGGNPMVGVPCGCFLPVERQGRKTGVTFVPERDPREQVVERRLLTVTRR